jgi:3-hydroxyacyl-CoA dehydrogenase/enoyl-CoA hydratase/3-hydroxybutyryl-CoA epimerase
VLAPYLNESLYILSEGVPIEKIDRALVEFGFPVGPIALLDEVGLDVAHKVALTLEVAFGVRMRPSILTPKLIDDERLGRKNARGFYQYAAAADKGQRRVDSSVYEVLGLTPKTSMTPEQLVERCVLAMLNEAVRCLEDGVLRSRRDADVGAIFGLGFPPYLGGPLRYADSLGPRAVVAALERLQQQHGERFQPARLLCELAESDGRFHD